jgi:molecular chaperone GrpE (heat shock protein)
VSAQRADPRSPSGTPTSRGGAGGIEISETPIPVSDLGAEPFTALEQDLRALMRELGETRYALEETRRGHREQLRTLLLGLLEAVDAFDRVFESVASRPAEITPQMKVWLSNFRTARLLLERVLADEGLSRETPDPSESFDPHRHRVSGTLVLPDRPDGAIVEVVVPGWLWKGALLRKSSVVIVYNGGDEVAGEPTEP